MQTVSQNTTTITTEVDIWFMHIITGMIHTLRITAKHSEQIPIDVILAMLTTMPIPIDRNRCPGAGAPPN